MKNIILVGSNGLIGKALTKGLSKRNNIIQVDLVDIKKKKLL